MWPASIRSKCARSVIPCTDVNGLRLFLNWPGKPNKSLSPLCLLLLCPERKFSAVSTEVTHGAAGKHKRCRFQPQEEALLTFAWWCSSSKHLARTRFSAADFVRGLRCHFSREVGWSSGLNKDWRPNGCLLIPLIHLILHLNELSPLSPFL